jgi:hypothetical protein
MNILFVRFACDEAPMLRMLKKLIGWREASLPGVPGAGAIPAVTVRCVSRVFDGKPHRATATAVAADGVTPVGGEFRILYSGSPQPPIAAGMYSVIACFTSKDPNHANAAAYGSINIARAETTITLSNQPQRYDGLPHRAQARAHCAGGNVRGSFGFLYDGCTDAPTTPGTYHVLAKFTSADPNFTDAIAEGTLTILPASVPTATLAAGLESSI